MQIGQTTRYIEPLRHPTRISDLSPGDIKLYREFKLS